MTALRMQKFPVSSQRNAGRPGSCRLSSGYLSSEQALEVLDALKNSAPFQEDQYSYILYPNKELPGFLQKNIFLNQMQNHRN
jgi:hypothetical protein